MKGTAELSEFLKAKKKDWIFEEERGIINKGIMGFSKGFVFVGHKTNEDWKSTQANIGGNLKMGDVLHGWDDEKIYFLDEERKKEWCVSDEAELYNQLVEICRRYFREKAGK